MSTTLPPSDEWLKYEKDGDTIRASLATAKTTYNNYQYAVYSSSFLVVVVLAITIYMQQWMVGGIASVILLSTIIALKIIATKTWISASCNVERNPWVGAMSSHITPPPYTSDQLAYCNKNIYRDPARV